MIYVKGNIAENWRTWKQQFQNFLTAKEADNTPDTVKIAMLLNCLGPESLERYNNFEFTEGEGQTYEAVTLLLQENAFGISSASEVLQKHAYETFGDIQELHILHDDALIAAETDAECDEILLKVLQRAKFNLKKMQLRQKVVTYMGRKIGADGVKPDPKKIQVIVDMLAPVDKTGIQRILGMLNFLSPFIPNMSTLTAPLRNRGTVPVEP
ncbi:retrovirus-related Pol polyprotein from transposon 297-like Protein [Elysia marginata]|uniref:Retrovirus-related Pol polyprotein from transposon 297-like Protein n=1 Tax=Elysia marginata TaxID=1093978 RepID=A0AAV4ED38_9GAST|nr:retrovirus-related Pol polyprotein from transposon 297-like Protein [Elysia marginata]